MFTPRALVAVLARPILWPTAIGAALSFTRLRWWARPPFLPLPDRRVMEWRVTTAYGRSDMTLAGEDLVSYLHWRRKA